MATGFIVTGLNVLVSVVMYPAYLHYLGYETYGVWIILSTVISLMQLSDFGIGQAVMKYVAEEHGRNNMSGIQGYMTTAVLALCGTGTLALLIVLFFRQPVMKLFNLASVHEQAALELLPYMGVLSVYGLVVNTYSAVLSGLGRFDLSSYSELSGRIIILLISLFMLSIGTGLKGLVISYAASYIIVHVFLLYSISRLSNHRVKLAVGGIKFYQISKLFQFGSNMMGSSIINMLLTPFNRLMLSRFAGVATVPIYEIAYNGAYYARSIIAAFFRAIAPEVSRISAASNSKSVFQVRELYRKAMRMNWVLSTSYFAIGFLLTTLLLRIWLGNNFVETAPVALRITLVGAFISSLSMPSYFLLMGIGRARTIFVSNVIQSVINCVFLGGIFLLTGKISINIVAFAVMLGTGFAGMFLMWQSGRNISRPSLVGKEERW
jgi:O-antigen/teichoic acid export membrane protein